jgi:hypothetical protein
LHGSKTEGLIFRSGPCQKAAASLLSALTGPQISTSGHGGE